MGVGRGMRGAPHLSREEQSRWIGTNITKAMKLDSAFLLRVQIEVTAKSMDKV